MQAKEDIRMEASVISVGVWFGVSLFTGWAPPRLTQDGSHEPKSSRVLLDHIFGRNTFLEVLLEWHSWLDTLGMTQLVRVSWCESIGVTFFVRRAWYDLAQTLLVKHSWEDTLGVTPCVTHSWSITLCKTLYTLAVILLEWHSSNSSKDTLGVTPFVRHFWSDTFWKTHLDIGVTLLIGHSWGDILEVTLLEWHCW